jgi:hypothetical protein
MAIYRPPKARWPLALGVGITALLVGLLIGLAFGSADPDPVEAAQDVRAEMVAAAGALEVAGIEYEESVSGGEVTRQEEYDGALSAVASARERYAAVRPALASLVPSLTEQIDDAFDLCERLMADTADPAEVGAALGELEGLLKGEAAGS